jgi:hypothetical protein
MGEDEPLKDEAAAREKWRGSEEPARPEGSGNSLPASEDEDERMGSGSGEGSAPVGPPGTIRPPD